jgi:hypothetical protein
MRIAMAEQDETFSLELFPDTLEDQALLVRFGMNSIKEVKGMGFHVGRNLKGYGVIAIGKRKNPYSRVK